MNDRFFSAGAAQRTRLLSEGKSGKGPAVYWMSREQRARDNWGLLAARQAASEPGRGLVVLFCFSPSFSSASSRHYSFLEGGLRETAGILEGYNIPLLFLYGDPGEKIPEACRLLDAALLVTDFDPYPEKRPWKKNAAASSVCPVFETDGHNIIPAWIVSPKKEFSAATFRRKAAPLLDEWLLDFPRLEPLPAVPPVPEGLFLSLDRALKSVRRKAYGPSISWIKPGESAASEGLSFFIRNRLDSYGDRRNNPAENGTSDLSPWLHFGHLSPQRAALEVKKTGGTPSRAAFLEELCVRRELADNFCHYGEDAGTYEGLPDWARKTLDEHRADTRPARYPLSRLESCDTGDPLWNAAQAELVMRGKMHGWCRMYWAKKILEWSDSPEEAFSTALLLNDRYSLDGRDPNGIAGVSWAVGGLHDRGWPERPVFGKIRYMNYRGAERKFSVRQYIEKINRISDGE